MNMKRSIFRAICLAAGGVFLASLALIMGVLYDYFSQTQEAQLKAQVRLAAEAVDEEGLPYLERLSGQGARVTWIAGDGSVLFDSSSPADSMENHLLREEIREALESGYGESARYSTTLMERQLYAAQRLSDGTVLRVSDAHLSPLSLFLVMLQPIAIICLIAAGLALALASGLSKRIVQPLNSLDLDEPQKNAGYEELRPLLRRIQSQQGQLRARQEEFAAATDGLQEGLILLNNKGTVLALNRAAATLLDIPRVHSVGEGLLALHPSETLGELLEQARAGERGELTLELHGTEYQINASPVSADGTVTGTALLLFDVSEKERAEQMRREFTANVSHELKTPLHSISGYAELLKEGMVRPEDVKRFAESIYFEAQRMIALVDDIIKLSHLEENRGDMRREEVHLTALVRETLQVLGPAAEKAGVSLRCTGGDVVVTGVPQLLRGIVYNLCDNAVKYNRAGGSVDVTVEEEEGEVVLTVADTGVGIPEEHQERVFERFYRVDKSRSKEVGGTGLGLSIVKHGVRLHRGEIRLDSKEGSGTTVTVRLPKK